MAGNVEGQGTAVAQGTDLPQAELARRLDASTRAHLRPAVLGVLAIYVLFALLSPFYNPPGIVASVALLNASAAVVTLALLGVVRGLHPPAERTPPLLAALLAIILAHLSLYVLVARPSVTLAVALFGPVLFGFGVLVPRTTWFAGMAASALLVYTGVLLILTPPADPWLALGLPLIEAAAVAGLVHLLHRWSLVRVETLRYHDERREARVRELQHRAEGEASRAGVYADELERSNEALQEFAYVVSHDLREPLRMVRSYLQLILRRAGGKFTEEERELFAYATDGAERMDTMIQGILSVSRVDTQGAALEPTSLDEALDDALQNLEVAIEEAGAEITREPLPQVVGDHGQLVQLLQNLVANAVKFTRDGEAPRIHVAAAATDGTCSVSVRDEGRGIPETEQANLFRPFHRGTTARDTEGAGIGLAVCRRIVDRHGGDIHLESQEGRGTTVTFTLPLAQDGDGAGDA